MPTEEWFQTVGQAHIRGLLWELTLERRRSTLNVDRVISEYVATTTRLRRVRGLSEIEARGRWKR